MWQLAMDATNASSGSMSAGFEKGAGTAAGEAEAAMVTPPSKLQWCSREYRPRRNSGPGPSQMILARCSDMVYLSECDPESETLAAGVPMRLGEPFHELSAVREDDAMGGSVLGVGGQLDVGEILLAHVDQKEA